MGTLDDYLLDMLRTYPDEKRLRLRRKAGVTTHIPLDRRTLDLRERTQEFGLELHSGEGYIAVAQYDIAKTRSSRRQCSARNGFTGSPFHHCRFVPSRNAAKCRWGASFEAMSVVPT